MIKRILPIILFLSVIDCGIPKAIGGRSTANLTTPGITALHTTESIKYLDIIRDTAIDSLSSKLISESTTTRIVNWHKDTLLTIKELPNGWSATVITGLNNLKDTLNPSEVKIIGPYIDSAIGLIKALGV